MKVDKPHKHNNAQKQDLINTDQTTTTEQYGN